MGHDLRGRFGIAWDGIPFEVDSGRDHQPVVWHATASREPDQFLLAIDGACHDWDNVDATLSHLVVVVPQRFEVAKTSDIEVRKEAGGKILDRLDQRNVYCTGRVFRHVAG